MILTSYKDFDFLYNTKPNDPAIDDVFNSAPSQLKKELNYLYGKLNIIYGEEIPEWDSNTEYFHFDVVKKTENGNVSYYYSNTDNNINNDLSSSNWAYLPNYVPNVDFPEVDTKLPSITENDHYKFLIGNYATGRFEFYDISELTTDYYTKFEVYTKDEVNNQILNIKNKVKDPVQSVADLDNIQNIETDDLCYVKDHKIFYIYDGNFWVKSSLSFNLLSDTPTSYEGKAGYNLIVNNTENGIIFEKSIKKVIDLEDFPEFGTTTANKFLKVNEAGNLFFERNIIMADLFEFPNEITNDDRGKSIKINNSNIFEFYTPLTIDDVNSNFYTNLNTSNFSKFSALFPNASTNSNKFLSLNTDGTGIVFKDIPTPPDPVLNFYDLEDTPNSYRDKAKNCVSVKEDETGLEFIDLIQTIKDNSSSNDNISLIKTEKFTASANQTDFNLTYNFLTNSDFIVFKNKEILYDNEEYSISNNVLTLTSGAAENDIIFIKGLTIDELNINIDYVETDYVEAGYIED